MFDHQLARLVINQYNKPMDKNLVISVKTIAITLLMILGALVIYKLAPIIGVLLVVLIVVISIEPMIAWFQNGIVLNRRIPRNVAVVLSYLVVLLVVLFIAFVVIPPLQTQSEKLIKALLDSLVMATSAIQTYTGVPVSLTEILPKASSLSQGVVSATIAIFENFTKIISLFILAIYVSMDWLNIKRKFFSLFPDRIRDTIEAGFSEVEQNLGQWVKGELILMLTIGLCVFLGLSVLNVRFPLALGIAAGALEIVPILGPVISAILAIAVSFADAPIKALAIVALFILINQAENSFLVPKVMARVSGFSPIVILIALLIGGQFFGVLGALLALPITIILTVVLKRVLRYTN
jgi:predicted PurR-regulated permease PerM